MEPVCKYYNCCCNYWKWPGIRHTYIDHSTHPHIGLAVNHSSKLYWKMVFNYYTHNLSLTKYDFWVWKNSFQLFDTSVYDLVFIRALHQGALSLPKVKIFDFRATRELCYVDELWEQKGIASVAPAEGGALEAEILCLKGRLPISSNNRGK